jgi:hypothetical protein
MNFEKIIYPAQVIAKDTPDLYKRAKKLGLVEGHPAVSLFESVLCEAELPNHNKVRLDKEALYDAVDTLKFMQVNFSHIGRGAICGFIFDAFINKKDQVIISCVFFKKIYQPEYKHAKKLFAKGELTMSYELTHDVDTAEKLSDGTRRIHDFYFTGAGLLIAEEPACENAIVYEFAKKMENQRQEIIYASKRNLKNVTQPKQKEITSILASLISQLNRENTNTINEQQKEGGNSIVNIEEIKAKLSEELGDLVKDWTDEDFQNEEKIAEARKSKDESAKVSENSDIDASSTVTVDEQRQTIIERDNNGNEIVIEKTLSVRTYTQEEVEEITAGYEKQISELKATLEVKDSEIAEVRANAEIIAKMKIEYANNEFTKEFKDEDWLNAEKIEEVKNLQAKKEKIEANKELLKENEFAKDFSDEDYANEIKVENAILKADKQKSDEKLKNLEAQKAEQTTTEEIEAEKTDDLETNHEEDVVASEPKKENALVRILKSKITK